VMLKAAFRRESEFWPYFSLFALAAAIYLPLLFSGKTTLIPTYQDQTQWQIYRAFVNKSFSSGHFPLWCDGLFSGFDFAGWGHSSSFYPLAAAFFFREYAAAVPLNQFLHLVIAAFGFYFLARKLGLGKAASFLSSSGYGLIYFLPMALVNFLPDIFALAFTPWIYGLGFALATSFKRKYFLGLSLLAGVQILSGHIESVALQYLSLLIFFLVFIFSERVSLEAKINKLTVLLLAIAFGAVMGMAAALPAFASYGQSFRKIGLSYSAFVLFPEHSMAADVLALFGVFASGLFIFVILCSWSARTRLFWATAVMIIFTLAQSFNWFNSLWILYHLPVFNRFIPHGRAMPQALFGLFVLLGMGLNNLAGAAGKKHIRALVPGLLILDGVYFYLCRHYLEPYSGRMGYDLRELGVHFLSARGILSVILILAGVSLLLFYRASRFRTAYYAAALQIVLFIEFAVTGWMLPPRHNMNAADPDPEYFKFLAGIDPREYRIQSVYSYDQWERLKTPLQTGVLNNTRAPDAYITFSTLRYTEFMKLLDPKTIRYEKDKVSDIQSLNILKRGDFVSLEKLPLLNLLNLKYMVGQDKNLKSASAYFIPYEFYRFDPRSGVEQGASFKEVVIKPHSLFGVFLYISPGDRLSVELKAAKARRDKLTFRLYFSNAQSSKQFIYDGNIESDKEINIDLGAVWGQTGKLVFSFLPGAGDDDAGSSSYILHARLDNPGKYFKRLDFKNIDVFENGSALPRAFMVHGVKTIPEKEQRLKYLGSAEFDPSQTAVWEKETWFDFPEKMPAPKGEVVIFDYEQSTPEDLKLLARNFYPAIVVLSESFYSGWRARLDGKETRILPVDHAFQGILIPSAGIHKLELKYEPASFNLALWFEICGIISWLSLLFISLIKTGR